MKAVKIFDLQCPRRVAPVQRPASRRILQISSIALLAASLCACAGAPNAGADFAATAEGPAAQAPAADKVALGTADLRATKPVDEQLAAKALALTQANSCQRQETMPDIAALALRAPAAANLTAPATMRNEAVAPVENETARLSQDEILNRLGALSAETKRGKSAAANPAAMTPVMTPIAMRDETRGPIADTVDSAAPSIPRDEMLQRLGALAALAKTKTTPAVTVADASAQQARLEPVKATATQPASAPLPAPKAVTTTSAPPAAHTPALAPALVKLRPESK